MPTITRVTAPRPRTRTLAAVALAATVVGVALAPAPVAAAPEPTRAVPAAALATVALPAVAAPTLSRVSGADRYAVSVAASRRAFPTGTTAPVVILVSDRSRTAGYGAIPAAAATGGSVLLTAPDALPASTAAELDRLNPARVVLVGDTTVIATAVAHAAIRYAPVVQRVGTTGPGRTSQALNRWAFGSATKAWVVTSQRATDAVAGATAAGAHRSPVIVLDGALADLPPGQCRPAARPRRHLGHRRRLGLLGLRRHRGRPAGDRGVGERRARLRVGPVRRDGTGQRPGLAGDGAGYRLPGQRPGHHQRASPGPCSPPAPSARCTSRTRSA